MDILLTYQGRRHIIETKLNRAKLSTTVQNAISQVASQYLLPERVQTGYVVIFDLKTPTGESQTPQRHAVDGKTATSFIISMRRS